MCRSRWLIVGGLVALTALPLMATDPKTDLKAEIERLKSPFASEVVTAARNIANLGPEGSAAVPAMAQALHRLPFPDDRIAMAKAISRMGPAAAPAVPNVVHALELATFPSERLAMIRILGDLGPAGKDAVPTLTKSLKAPFADERKAAADSLGRLGPTASAAIPALTEASQIGYGDIRLAAREALRRIQATDGRIGIVDQAKMFNHLYLRGQQETVVHLARRFEIDLLIETLATPPRDPSQRNRPESPTDALATIPLLARERIKERKLNGVYVLITREPAHVHVETTGRGQALVDDVASKKLVETFMNEFKFRRYDNGLANGLTFLRTKLASGSSDPTASGRLQPGLQP